MPKKTIAQLGDGDCRYLVKGTTIYCGDPVLDSTTSFCEVHHRRCYVHTNNKRTRFPIMLPLDKIEEKRARSHIPDVIESMK